MKNNNNEKELKINVSPDAVVEMLAKNGYVAPVCLNEIINNSVAAAVEQAKTTRVYVIFDGKRITVADYSGGLTAEQQEISMNVEKNTAHNTAKTAFYGYYGIGMKGVMAWTNKTGNEYLYFTRKPSSHKYSRVAVNDLVRDVKQKAVPETAIDFIDGMDIVISAENERPHTVASWTWNENQWNTFFESYNQDWRKKDTETLAMYIVEHLGYSYSKELVAGAHIRVVTNDEMMEVYPLLPNNKPHTIKGAIIAPSGITYGYELNLFEQSAHTDIEGREDTVKWLRGNMKSSGGRGFIMNECIGHFDQTFFLTTAIHPTYNHMIAEFCITGSSVENYIHPDDFPMLTNKSKADESSGAWSILRRHLIKDILSSGYYYQTVDEYNAKRLKNMRKSYSVDNIYTIPYYFDAKCEDDLQNTFVLARVTTAKWNYREVLGAIADAKTLSEGIGGHVNVVVVAGKGNMDEVIRFVNRQNEILKKEGADVTLAIESNAKKKGE